MSDGTIIRVASKHYGTVLPTWTCWLRWVHLLPFFIAVPVTAALTLGSTALGSHVYFETSAVIITLIKLGKLLEVRAKDQTGAAIKKLMGLQAKTARVVRNGAEVDIPIEQVVVGDVVSCATGGEDSC